MNITDDIVAGESHFSACVNRAQTIIASVKTLPEKQFAFIALDELFNSTVFVNWSRFVLQHVKFSWKIAQYYGNGGNPFS